MVMPRRPPEALEKRSSTSPEAGHCQFTGPVSVLGLGLGAGGGAGSALAAPDDEDDGLAGALLDEAGGRDGRVACLGPPAKERVWPG